MENTDDAFQRISLQRKCNKAFVLLSVRNATTWNPSCIYAKDNNFVYTLGLEMLS